MYFIKCEEKVSCLDYFSGSHIYIMYIIYLLIYDIYIIYDIQYISYILYIICIIYNMSYMYYRYRIIYPDRTNLENLEIPALCGTVQVFSTCTGILRIILNRLIKIRQTVLYKYMNFYLLKTVSLFTFSVYLYILGTIISLISLYPEILRILKSGPLPAPSLPDI